MELRRDQTDWDTEEGDTDASMFLILSEMSSIAPTGGDGADGTAGTVPVTAKPTTGSAFFSLVFTRVVLVCVTVVVTCSMTSSGSNEAAMSVGATCARVRSCVGQQ